MVNYFNLKINNYNLLNTFQKELMKASEITIKCMEKEYFYEKMAENMMENIQRIKNKDMEFFIGYFIFFTKVQFINYEL